MNRKQPIVKDLREDGELVWALEPMELWQILQCYRKQYTGDFSEQWMWAVLYSAGLDWDKYKEEGI